MDRYQKVEKPKADAPINENELRITAQGRMRNYISYALSLLQEKDAIEIVLKATGRAINKTVMIVELLKRRVAGLHQNTSIGSINITDTWEPLEEGLLPIETSRHVSIIIITLSKKELDLSSTGYQPPIPADQVRPLADFDEGDAPSGNPSRGRGGQRRSRGIVSEYSNGDQNGGNDFGGRGRGRGRGRNFRGRGRGYGNGNIQQQDSGYYNGYGDGNMQQQQQQQQQQEPRYHNEYNGQSRGRARGSGRGRGGGRGRTQGYQPNTPAVEASV